MIMKTVGKFQIDETGMFSGPNQYMTEQGSCKLDEIMAGKCISFNMTCHLSPDIETAVLVAMQTDYAGWIGLQQTLNWVKS